MKKQVANLVLFKLDSTADTIETLAKEGKIEREAAVQLLKNLDSFADRFEIAAFGEKNLKARQAKVIQQDNDESYMKTFDNVNEVHRSDADEPYMHKSPPSFNSKGIDNYDQDASSAVSTRDEYQVRDLSEHADGTKPQPSWPNGSAGKSTRQGTTQPKSWA